MLVVHGVVTDEFDEESLERHDRELTCVRQYYRDNSELLEKVARRQALWANFMEFEVSVNARHSAELLASALFGSNCHMYNNCVREILI